MVDARAGETAEPQAVDHEFTAPHVGRFGVATAGLLAVIVSAWGGIVPYVGPVFGFSGDGNSSWHWDLAHSVLALIPAVAGVLLGLFVMGAARSTAVTRGRFTLGMAGFFLMVCGAWFAIGPLAWPVIYHGDVYFVHTASHLRILAYEVGYAIGTGLIVMGCGGFVSGWASRHQPRATLPAAPARAAAPTAEPVESGI
jgi:hypothetical protein